MEVKVKLAFFFPFFGKRGNNWLLQFDLTLQVIKKNKKN